MQEATTKNMFYGRLEPQHARRATRPLWLLTGLLGLAAAATPSAVVGAVREPPLHLTRLWIGQTPAARPPSPNRVNPQTPPPAPQENPRTSAPSTRVITNPPTPGTPAKAGGSSPANAAGVGPQKRIAPRTAPRARGPRKPVPVNRPLPVNKGKIQPPLPSSKPLQHAPTVTGGSAPGEGPTQETETGTAKRTPLNNPPIASGRRDPFKAWVPPSLVARAGSEAAPLPVGIRGLVISGLRLEGIVRGESADNMIAVVTNYTKRAYFLRVNDAVHNGVVSKITPEAIYFNENILDSRGRVATHEVEIKLGSAPGEGR